MRASVYGLHPEMHPPRRRRPVGPTWLRVIIAVVLATAGLSLALSPIGAPRSAVTAGGKYRFPDEVPEAVAFWEAQGWPAKPRNVRYKNATGVVASAGIYFDDSHELRDFIAETFPDAVVAERQFLHFDVAWRADRGAPRTDPRDRYSPVNRRLIYDTANGLIFYTPDHYGRIYLYARDNDALGAPGAAAPAEIGEEAPPTDDVGPGMDMAPSCASGVGGTCPATDRAYLRHWADELGDRDRIMPTIHAHQAVLIRAFVSHTSPPGAYT